ncbi:MAG: DinB family protein [Candidatus Hodarchaeales archaeon]
MKDHLIKAISGGLHGTWTHVDPIKAIKGLSPANARKKPEKTTHSCWELLHHIYIWQDALLRQIKGETLDWNEIEKKDNWPEAEVMTDDSFGGSC